MGAFPLIMMTVVLLPLAAYAQARIPAHTSGSGKVLLTRAILGGIGIALGWQFAASYPEDPPLALLAFLVGFGMVHFPAALILFFKHHRGEGKS